MADTIEEKMQYDLQAEKEKLEKIEKLLRTSDTNIDEAISKYIDAIPDITVESGVNGDIKNIRLILATDGPYSELDIDEQIIYEYWQGDHVHLHVDEVEQALKHIWYYISKKWISNRRTTEFDSAVLNKKELLEKRVKEKFGNRKLTKEEAEGLGKAGNEDLIQYSRYLLVDDIVAEKIERDLNAESERLKQIERLLGGYNADKQYNGYYDTDEETINKMIDDYIRYTIDIKLEVNIKGEINNIILVVSLEPYIEVDIRSKMISESSEGLEGTEASRWLFTSKTLKRIWEKIEEEYKSYRSTI